MGSCYAGYAIPIHHTTRSHSPHNTLHLPSNLTYHTGLCKQPMIEKSSIRTLARHHQTWCGMM